MGWFNIMEMTTSDKKCLDIESPFEQPDKNYSVLKNTPLDKPIYSHFEFHITKETKRGCYKTKCLKHVTIIKKFCLVYFLDNISYSLVIFNRALFHALGLLRSNCENL